MPETLTAQFRCPRCQQEKPLAAGRPVDLVYQAVRDLILKEFPALHAGDFICRDCVNHYRADYVQATLEREQGELSDLEREVIESLRQQELFAHNFAAEFDSQLTAGDRIADRVAEFGGSWRFIITFASILVLWIIVNTAVLIQRPFDPYPFILLNLVLSCLAALQAPVIMMSQNRQEAKDRLRAEHDYQINLKAELEIRHLSRKLDQLMHHQWLRLLEIKQIQVELADELERGPEK